MQYTLPVLLDLNLLITELVLKIRIPSLVCHTGEGHPSCNTGTVELIVTAARRKNSINAL